MTEEAGTTLAIIVAAGEGRRLEAPLAKQFLEICGEPVLVHALRAFEQSPWVSDILLVLPASDRESFRQTLSRFSFRKVVDLIPGGEERQDSVRAGLVWSRTRRPALIMVHDGVRPLVDQQLIERVWAAAHQHGAAVPGLRAAETIKHVQGGFVAATVDREELYLVQTPQAFRAEVLWAAFDRASEMGLRATDEAAVVEAYGHPVALVEGSALNLKITRREDLKFAEMLLGGQAMHK